MPNYQMPNTMTRIFYKNTACLSESQIVQYIQNVVSDEERFLIERHITECDVCYEAVQGMSKLGPNIDVKVTIDRLAHRLDERFVKKRTPLMRSPITYYSIAATALIILASTWYLSFRNPYRKLIADNCRPYPNTIPLVRDTKSATLLESALTQYELEDYRNAAELFQKLLSVEPGNMKGHFYAGVSYLMTEEPDKSIEEFKTVLRSTSEFSIEAKWYLAWAYLKNKDMDQAKHIFQGIADGQNAFSEQARNIIKELN